MIISIRQQQGGDLQLGAKAQSRTYNMIANAQGEHHQTQTHYRTSQEENNTTKTS